MTGHPETNINPNRHQHEASCSDFITLSLTLNYTDPHLSNQRPTQKWAHAYIHAWIGVYQSESGVRYAQIPRQVSVCVHKFPVRGERGEARNMQLWHRIIISYECRAISD